MRRQVSNYNEAKRFFEEAAGKAVYQDLEFPGAVLTTEAVTESNLYENGGCMKKISSALKVKF